MLDTTKQNESTCSYRYKALLNANNTTKSISHKNVQLHKGVNTVCWQKMTSGVGIG